MKSFKQFATEDIESPAHHLPYREFKKIPGEKHLNYHPDHFTAAQNKNPGKKHHVVFSLGSSHHDPQAMYKIVSGDKVPKGIKSISTHREHEAAWQHIQKKEKESYGLSRNS